MKFYFSGLLASHLSSPKHCIFIFLRISVLDTEQLTGSKLGKEYATKSLQLCPTLCDPIDSSPPGPPILGVLQARTLEWVAISFSNAWKWKVKVKSLSHVRLLATPWTAAYQAPLSMAFSRQEYWSGLPLPSPIYMQSTEYINVKCQTGWITSWNQDCQEKYHNLRYAQDTTLMAESEEELKSHLMRVKEKSEKSWLKIEHT